MIPAERLPYVVVEVDAVPNETGTTWLRRWVVLDGRGETVSPPVPFRSASVACAAVQWWLLAPLLPATSRVSPA